MAREPMTLKQIKSTHPAVDRAKIAAMTDADIRCQQIEDGEDPDAPPPPFRPVQNAKTAANKLSGKRDRRGRTSR